MKRSTLILAPGLSSAAVLLSLVFVGCGREHSAPKPAWHVEMAPAGEPGERLDLSGTLSDARGRPLSGAAILAFHQNAEGSYVPRLRARFHTGPAGDFRLNTIVPGGVVRVGEPPHIHFDVEAHGHPRQQLTTYLLLDGAPNQALAPLLEQPPPLFPDPLKAPMIEFIGPHGIPATRDCSGVWRATAKLMVRSSLNRKQ